MLEGYAGCIMVGFEECRQHYKHPEKIVVTGTPVRGDFFRQTKEQAREKLDLDDRPLAVSFWGSLGARFMNEHMLDFFRLEARNGMPFHHIHAWQGQSDTMRQTLEAEQLTKTPGLDVRSISTTWRMSCVRRIGDLPGGSLHRQRADGAGSPGGDRPLPLRDQQSSGKKCPDLEKHGGARVILEKEPTGDALYRAAGEIPPLPSCAAA